MKAAILRGKRDIRCETVPDPKIEAGGIIVKVKACGICGSDLHPYRQGGREGITFGHEFSGVVSEVGEGVKDIQVDDRVVGIGLRTCGECYWCKRGEAHRCTNISISGEHFDGAMADYVLLPNARLNWSVFKLPDHLSFEEGATAEPLSIASFSVRRGKVKPENTAAVIGAGMIGLCVTQVLKAMGVSKIIVSEREGRRLQAARESGADLVIDAATEDALQAVMSTTDGLGVDVVIECSGNPASFTQAMAMCRGGGMIVQTALFEQPVTFNPAAFTTKNLTITGIQGEHFPSALELLSSGKVNTKLLITHQFPLNQVKEAFEVLTTTPDAIKVLIKP